MTTTPANGDARWIVSTTPETFEHDVFERSREVPIVVDFWAVWCAPCRALTPILEKLAAEYAGRFVLVKADTDKLQAAAAQFNVQGIPAVYAVIDGRPIDFFTGALPESQVRSWLDRVCLAGLLSEAKRWEATCPDTAAEKYRLAIQQSDTHDATARIGLARVLFTQDEIEECQQILQELEQRGFLEPEAEKIKSALELRGTGHRDIDACRRAANAAPDDLELSYQLAKALAAAEQFEEALKTCLTLVERDKAEMRERARELMVDIFRVLPGDSELTRTYRRKLSMAMY